MIPGTEHHVSMDIVMQRENKREKLLADMAILHGETPWNDTEEARWHDDEAWRHDMKQGSSLLLEALLASRQTTP